MKFVYSVSIRYLLCFIFIVTGTALLAEIKKEYEGRVIEIAEEDGRGALKTSAYLKYPGKAGAWVLWIIQPGTYVKEGTLLVHTDPTFVLIDIEKAKARVHAQSLILKEAKSNMLRSRDLIKKDGVSVEELENSEKNYYNTMLSYQYAEKDLKKSELDLEYVDIKAPYDCFIEKVYAKVASSSNIDFPVLKILRLSPLYIDVKLDRTLAKKIYDMEVGVSVYPTNSDGPVGIFNENVKITEDGIRLPVRNYQIEDSNNKGMKIIHDVSYVMSYVTEKTDGEGGFGILESLFYEDDKGTYIWKAVGQKTLRPGKIIESEFPVEKVYIEKTDEKKEGFDGKLYQIKENNKLQLNDVLIKNAPKTLKDGEKVLYKKIEFLFWPGDTVKVILNIN